jgi:prepilin-type N-terminal cleavage/methylation domain-containing protein
MLNIRLKKLRKTGIARDEKGFTLVEVVISIMLLGLISAALATGLSTSSKVLLHTDIRETAKNLAETQMEYIKLFPFASAYDTTNPPVDLPAPPVIPSGYSVEIQVDNGLNQSVFGSTTLTDGTVVSNRDSNIQKITVTITGPAGITYPLNGYKVR